MANNDKTFVKLAGVPDYVNKIINNALSSCYKYKCGSLNGVNLLLATIESLDNFEEKVEKCNTTHALLISSFEYKVGCGDYGSLVDAGPSDLITNYTPAIINKVLAHTGKGMNIKCAFLTALNEYKDRELQEYLKYTHLDLEKLISIEKSGETEEAIEIPDYLKRFLKDSNAEVKAKNETIEDVDVYVDEMVNILCRKNKKNPCLVGEAGVGKTTIVEALIKRINAGNVPKELKGAKVISVSSSAILGGTRYRGDFEERLARTFAFLTNKRAIMFIDEIHTFMNLGGGGDGSQTAGNMIKEYLSDGRISIIGTTTPKEWHKFIEQDSALKRRLQEVIIDEPSVELATHMVKHSISNYEKFHSVKITDEAIKSAVKLSDRYMKSEKLPDKAFKIIDQASAIVKIRDAEKKERFVTEDDIALVVSKLSGVDVNKLKDSEIDRLRNLENNIHKQLIGQDNAVSVVSKAIRRGKVGVRDSSKPVASLLFVGPTGVGKTELCRVLSKELFDNKESFIKVDMSEYSEEYSTSKLIGSAPGYVGYGEGGQLTEKVKKHPYSLVLLDEIEKANPKVFDSFLQVLDDGVLTDAEGQKVDFTNCIIVMTSNAGYGADQLNRKSIGFDMESKKNLSYNEKEKIAMKALEGSFRPEFINRFDNIVIFDSLDKTQAREIASLAVDKLANRLHNKDMNVEFNADVIDHITDIGYSDKYGARNINRAVQDVLEDSITDAILDGRIRKDTESVIRMNNNEVEIISKE